MPFEINPSTPKVYNQLSNGVNFDQNIDNFDTTFTGNTEKLRVEITYDYTWFSSSQSFNWNVQNGRIESVTQNFQNEGFEIGQTFEFYSDWNNRFITSAEFTGQITNILQNGNIIEFQILVGVQSTLGANISNTGIWANAADPVNAQNALIVKFGLPLESSNNTFSSLIDSQTQKYSTDQIQATGETILLPASNTIGHLTGQLTYENTTSTVKNSNAITIRHDLLVNPYWLDTDTPNVLINPPNSDVKQIVSNDNIRFAGSECLRYIQELELRTVYTSSQNRNSLVELEGNTGWFQDNFNSGSRKFELLEDSFIYNAGGSTSLLFGQVNNIEFYIQSSPVTTGVASDARFGVYFSILPPSNRYQNKQTSYIENFVYDGAINTVGLAAVAGENNLLSNVVGVLENVAGNDMIKVTASLDLTGTQALGNDNFIIWTGCESETVIPVVPLPFLACNTTIGSISTEGVREWQVNLQSGGGVLNLSFDSQIDADKMEILHNGIKVSTSGMTVANSGPFDVDNGTANYPAADQYINSTKGVIPTREADFLAENGFSQTCQFEQLVWWNYDSADFAVNPIAIVRVSKKTGNNRFIQNCIL